jgi:pimeloyl-ACP methyl ester carboxylesterase
MAGWSTTAPFIIGFSGAVDVATVVPGASLRIFEVTLLSPGGPVTGVVSELTGGDFSVALAPEDATGATVRVFLDDALDANTSYMVVLTDAITDLAGDALTWDSEYFLAKSTDPYPAGHPIENLQPLVNAMEAAAAGQGIATGNIIMSYTFTTQAVGAALGALRSIANGGEAGVISSVCAILPFGCADTTPDPLNVATLTVDTPAAGTTLTFLGAGPDAADVYEGSLTIPTYLTPASNPSATLPVTDPAPLDGFWTSRYEYYPGDPDMAVTRFNFLPEVKGAETVPVLISIPKAGIPPAGGWPIVVFQHGVTNQRTSMLLVADALALAGFGCIAIDLPLHGLSATPTNPLTAPLFRGYLDGTRRERTYGLDLVDNVSGAPVPDGVVDTSGKHFINLANLLTARDNLRQAISDLFFLMTEIPGIDFVNNTTGVAAADGTPDFNAARIHFVGHSLGAIVGASFLGLETEIVSATLGMPGGGLAKLLDGSLVLGPLIQAGLAAAGVLPGTPEYEQFFWLAQTMLDSGDPINWADALTAQGTPLHMIEVVGGGPGGGIPDPVVPNSVADAPLSGTEPLISALGLASISTTTVDAGGIRGVVRFVDGTHGSLLLQGTTPEQMAAFTEMQIEFSTFAATSGTTLPITDPTVVQ